MNKSPGKAFREGVSLIELMDLFPDEAAAVRWFESIYWTDGRCCGHCGATNTREVPNAKPMPYWCPDCKSYFSVRTGTAMERSKIPLRKWAIAIHLCLTSLKSVSSMKLHRDLRISQKSAWFMLHRLRQAWVPAKPGGPSSGPVEVDETYMGGKRKNMGNAKREALADTGRRPVDKTAVVGVKDRATKRVAAGVVDSTDKATLQDSVTGHTAPLRVPRSTLTKRRPTRASRSRTRRSSTPSPSTCAIRRTPTASRAYGPC